MFFQAHLKLWRCLLLAAVALLLVAGCSGGQSADRALDKSLAANGQHREPVAPLSGKITIDGAAPELAEGERIIAMLVDATKLEGTSPTTGPHVAVGQSGEFAFRTYEASDGVKPGTYIVTFARLKVQKRNRLIGPDGFHNLYNDAARNDKEYPELKIDHQAPGKTDYQFDLKIAGRDEGAAGPRALTHLN